MTISKTHYKDAPGWLLENAYLQVILLARGAKIQSIRYDGKEWLCQNPGSTFVFAQYGETFEQGEFSGFDDMFPNISAGPYPGGVWDGIRLPDHGEVWTQDWDCHPEKNRLCCQVNGVRLPYMLEKSAALSGSSLSLHYRASNPTAYPMKCLWAAHPLFVLEDPTYLLIDGCNEIINVADDPQNLGSFGQHHPWPVSRGGRDMRVLRRQNATYNKYYVWNALEKNSVKLYYPDRTTIHLDAPPDQVPYLGIWTDECGYGDCGMGCVAPEPCTGAFDSLHLADSFGKILAVPPRSAISWMLSIHFGKEDAYEFA